MGKTVLKNKDGLMVKSFDTANTVLEFTDNIEEAHNYEMGEWFANTELDYLKFHCKEHLDKLETMKVTYIPTAFKKSSATGEVFGMPMGEVEIVEPIEEEQVGAFAAAVDVNGMF